MSVWDGDQVPVGSESLEVIGLVGHTPGSVTVAYRPATGPVHLFTGDSLFPGGPGRTTNPTDFGTLMADLETKIFASFDDDTVVHPGHGDDTTLGRERPHLPDWRARGW
jgi:glyoxylase-like metal-dependent hydrolase (beta-lactamase superfamily II)